MSSYDDGEDTSDAADDYHYYYVNKQYVNIDGCLSTLRDANLGVPQGSILGPVLFLIFIDHLPQILENSAADIYADDTTISANVD